MSEKQSATETAEKSNENLPYEVGPPNGERFIKKVRPFVQSAIGTVKNHKVKMSFNLNIGGIYGN